MRTLMVRAWPIAMALTACSIHADTLVMRDGKKLDGTVLGSTARQIEFLPFSGTVVKVPIESVVSVQYSMSPAPADEPAPKQAKAASRPAVTLPAGTAFRVKTIDPIDVDVTQAGHTFRGSIDDPITSKGDVVVPRGADVVLVAAKVEQGGKMKGSDLIELKVNSIVVNGRSYQVATSVSQTKTGGEGKKTAGKVVGGAGLGAIIGGIAGGGAGAGIGALVGGAGGTIVAASGQPHLKIPSETRLEFQLRSDWKIR